MTLTDDSSYPIRDAFQKFLPEYLGSHSLTPQQWKTANCIANCKTGGLGYNVSYCEECGHIEIHASSCNNRHCPCCQAPIEQKWIMERNSELIEGIAYYHAIFTVPYELNSLIYENQELLYGLMFRCATDTLLTLCRDKKYLGTTPGIVSVLHTQGQRLNFHPHIHTMLSGGGLTPSGQFVEAAHKGYLLPKEAMGRLYRGKFLAALKKYHDQKKLQFRGGCLDLRNRYEWQEFIDRLYQKDWIPHIKETFNGFGNAVTYLARYVFRSAISNSRIDSVDGSGVTFHYKDYADGGKTKSMHMGGTEFIDAFLMHVLPKGFCRVRFSGYLCNCQKTKKLKLIHKLRNTIYNGNPVKGKTVAELMLLLYGRDICTCPVCHGKKIHLPRGVSLDAFSSRRTLTS